MKCDLPMVNAVCTSLVLGIYMWVSVCLYEG